MFGQEFLPYWDYLLFSSTSPTNCLVFWFLPENMFLTNINQLSFQEYSRDQTADSGRIWIKMSTNERHVSGSNVTAYVRQRMCDAAL